MSKLETISDKVAFPVGGGLVVWPFYAPSAEEYANAINMIALPTLGLCIALLQLFIMVRKWYRGSKWCTFVKSEDGFIGRRSVVYFGLASAVLASAAAPVISHFEGRSLTAYYDIVGVATICDGITRDVKIGDIATAEECDAFLVEEIQRHAKGLAACVDDTVEAKIPKDAGIAFLSWTYNVGVGAACRSTLVRMLNAGDIRGACNELPRWNRAGGKVIRGLSNRRGVERSLCLGALT